MSKILSTEDELNLLPNNTLSIYKDMEDKPCFILKDNDLKDLNNVEMIHYSEKNLAEVFLLKHPTNKLYKTKCNITEETQPILSKLSSSKFVNLFLLYDDKSFYPVNQVYMNHVKFYEDIINFNDN